MNTNKEIAIDYMCTNLCTEPHQIVLPEDLHLEHWLAVLGEKNIVLIDIVTGGDIAKASVGETYITLNLITGQPNSPEDYKAFNDLVGV